MRGRPRPALVVAVVGTGTEVGKTWVTVAVAEHLRRRGIIVAARKPAQSFTPDTGPTDADLLALATGADPRSVCPAHRWYPVPMAPPMAAEALGLAPPTLADLVDELGWDPVAGHGSPGGPDVGIVETAGGLRSPQAADGDGLALVDAIHPDVVVLVADAGLGTINSVRLCRPLLAPWPHALILNRYSPAEALHRANHTVLRTDDEDARGEVFTDVPALADHLADHLADRLAARVADRSPPRGAIL